MKGLTDEENEMLNELWLRYHDGQMSGLPAQVYFDMGRVHGLVAKLANKVYNYSKPQYFGVQKPDDKEF